MTCCRRSRATRVPSSKAPSVGAVVWSDNDEQDEDEAVDVAERQSRRDGGFMRDVDTPCNLPPLTLGFAAAFLDRKKRERSACKPVATARESASVAQPFVCVSAGSPTKR